MCDDLFFYLFLSSKEVQMSPLCKLFKSLLGLLFADGRMGQSHHYKGKGPCVNSVVDQAYQDIGAPRDRKSVGFPHHNQTIKNLILRRVTSFTSVCFVCRAVVNTFSACPFQI